MDKYKVLKRIGVGTYGSAYLVCLKAMSSEQFVLKKIKLEQGDEKERQQAEQEVRVLMLLSYPLVLSYVDHFLYKGHLCIVTDYCDAGDLYRLLRSRKNPLPEGQLLELFAQIVLSIQYLHQKNILHRDLKTQNIFLTSEGNIKLGDFGISRSLNSTMDLASTIIGTPYYMSPEVMSSMPYDFKSDMWSLGCVLYEMMSLKHAFDAVDMTSLVMKILRGEHLPIPQGFSAELRDLVRQLLSKNPKMRPSADQVLKMPFLKESVARAREVVTVLEQRAAASRVHRQSLIDAPGPSHRHSRSQSEGPGPVAAGGTQLDRELEAAKERLRRIQLEREALHKQAYAGAASSNGTNHKLVTQHSEPNLLARPPASAHAKAQPVAVPGPSSAAAAAAAAQLKGRSWRDPDQAQRQLRQPPPKSAMQYGNLSGDIDAALERHRGQRQLRSSRPQSPEIVNGGSGGGPSSGSSPPNMDPKARMLRRKEEEAKRREAELLNARKAYFEERKQAAAKLQQLYTPSPQHALTNRLSARRVTEPSDGWLSHQNTSHGHAQYGSPSLRGEASDASALGGHGGYSHSGTARKQQSNHVRISSSDSELDEPRGAYGEGGGAMQEFEAELQAQQAYAVSGRHFDSGAGLSERMSALRDVCSYNLGQPLYELIYGYIRKRMAQGLHDDPAFKAELQQRLGPSRMQYVHLLDQLIYFEDMQALQAGLS